MSGNVLYQGIKNITFVKQGKLVHRNIDFAQSGLADHDC